MAVMTGRHRNGEARVLAGLVADIFMLLPEGSLVVISAQPLTSVLLCYWHFKGYGAVTDQSSSNRLRNDVSNDVLRDLVAS